MVLARVVALSGIACVALAADTRAQQRFAELPHAHLPRDAAVTPALAALDADGDGDLDLVVGNLQAVDVLWLNDGHGAFQTAPAGNLPAALADTTALVAADLNGDTLVDLVIGIARGSTHVLMNSGGGWFLPPFNPALPPSSASTASLAAFDMDGDGDLDLVEGNSGGTDRLLENDGRGVFIDVTAGRLATGGSNAYTRDLVVFDADADGDLDLLQVEVNGGPRLGLNDGRGWFQPGAPLPFQADVFCAAAGDVDGDGDLDLVFGRQASNPLQRQDVLLLNDGRGVFTAAAAARLPQLENWTSDIALLDVDGDGDLDIVAGSTRISGFGPRSGLALWLGDGAGTFVDAGSQLPQNDLTATVFVALDADGDGDQELAFSDLQSSHEHLYWNEAGRFVHATGSSVPLRRASTAAAAAGDLDHDGDLDVVVAGTKFQILNGLNALLVNDGTGAYAEAATPPAFPNGFYEALVFGDIDGDGDLDLACGLDQPGQNRLYRNDGGLTFTDVTAQLPVASDWTRDLLLFDADADGDLDLFAGNSRGSTLALNDGTGRFSDATATLLPPARGGTYDAAVGDVDGDGDPDLVLGNDGFNQLWLNRGGGGGFADASPQLPAVFQHTDAVALADVDGDGDLDLLVGNRVAYLRDPRDWLLRNDGTGAFLTQPIVLGTGDTRAIAAGDIEADGDVDFVLGGQSEPLRLFENQGGLLLSQTSFMPSELRRTAELLLLDADGDGDLDLFEADAAEDRLLRALHLNLASRRLAVLGGPLQLDLHVMADPATLVTAVLLIGVPTGPVATPWGALRVSPASLALGPVQFTGSGTMLMPAIPNLPGLRGVVAGFQAFVMRTSGPTSIQLTGLQTERVR